MAEIEWGVTLEEDKTLVRTMLQKHETDLNGNGQPGIKDFISQLRGQGKMGLVIMSVIGLMLGWLTYRDATKTVQPPVAQTTTTTTMTQKTVTPVTPDAPVEVPKRRTY